MKFEWQISYPLRMVRVRFIIIIIFFFALCLTPGARLPVLGPRLWCLRSNTWHDALLMSSRASSDQDPVAGGVKLLSSGWEVESRCWETPQELEKIWSWGVRYMVWTVDLWRKVGHIWKLIQGDINSFSCLVCISGISDFFLSMMTTAPLAL